MDSDLHNIVPKQRPLFSARFCGTNQASWTRDPRQKSRSPLWISTCSLCPPGVRHSRGCFSRNSTKATRIIVGVGRFNSSALIGEIWIFFFFELRVREAKSLFNIYPQTKETFLKISFALSKYACGICFKLLRSFGKNILNTILKCRF